MRIWSLLAVSLLLGSLAGCNGSDDGDDGPTTTSQPSTGQPFLETFTTWSPGSAPAGWSIHNGAWGGFQNLTDIAHTNVARGSSASGAALNSIVADKAGTYRDMELKVAFKMLEGEAGAGVVTHFWDENNYNILRYSVREQGWDVFTMIDGERVKRDEASVLEPTTHPEFGQWVQLRVVSQAGHLTAYDGAVKVLDYALPTEASHVGAVGLFLRDVGTTALFDDLSVTPG